MNANNKRPRGIIEATESYQRSNYYNVIVMKRRIRKKPNRVRGMKEVDLRGCMWTNKAEDTER